MPDYNENPLLTKDIQGGGGIGYTGLPVTSVYYPTELLNPDQNLQNLFGTLNQISLQGRSGSGGRGGGSERVEGNQDANPLIGLNPYMGENVTSFNRGGRIMDANTLKEFVMDLKNVERGVYKSPYEESLRQFRTGNQFIDNLLWGSEKREQTYNNNLYTERWTPESLTNLGPSSLQYLLYDKGGQLTPKEMKKVQNLGRFGDTQLAHVNPQEAAMLKAMGGSGTINPYTGLPEYWGFFKALKSIFGGVSDALQTVTDPLDDILNPVFDAAGNIVDPALGAASDIGSAAGGIATGAAKGIIEGSLKGVRDVGHNVLMPIIKTIGEPIGDIIREPVDMASDFVWGAVDALTGGGEEEGFSINPYNPNVTGQKPVETRGGDPVLSGLRIKGPDVLSNIQKSADPAGLTAEGDWVSDKPNPYVTPNVEEELAYANKGMKMPNYNQGGHYLRQANQAIAMNQISNLVSNTFNRRMPMAAANKGMKMRKRYTNGGRF